MKPAWDTLKLLAEPTRLRILAMLLSAELSGAELPEAPPDVELPPEEGNPPPELPADPFQNVP